MQLRHKTVNTGKDPCAEPDGPIPLTCLQEGAQAIVAHASGDENVVRRLSEMGLTPGCVLKLLRKCSFRGPLEIEVRGVSLALGYALASEVYVQQLKTQND